MRMKKLFLAIAFCVVVGVVFFFSKTACAATEGMFNYSIKYGAATITGCKTSIIGDIVLPSTLGGYPVRGIGESAFESCESLTSITIPNSVTEIGAWAFYDCESLTSITIPDSVTMIGSYAFCDCESLTSITIPDSVTTIGKGAFEHCRSFANLYIEDIAAWCNIDFGNSSANPMCDAYNVFLNDVLLKNAVIPEGVTKIKAYAFYDCESLRSITIPDSVTEIGESAFDGCESLTSITIPDSVTTIGSSAFMNCRSLISITIPDSVTTIEGYAFGECDSLTSITISDSVTYIGKFAFEYCESLTSITIPDSVTTIGMGAFFSCSRLTNVVLPSGITEIPENMFGSCYNIQEVTIPSSIQKIEDDAFSRCNVIRTIKYGGSAADWENVLIGSNNGNLQNATVEYGVTMPPQVEPGKPKSYPYTISDLFLKAIDGTTLQTPPAKEGFWVNVKFYEREYRSKEDYVFVAVYSTDEELLRLDYVLENFAINTYYNFDFYVPVQEKPIGKIKAYIWHNFGDVTPLTRVKEI